MVVCRHVCALALPLIFIEYANGLLSHGPIGALLGTAYFTASSQK
jgi:hypothetical protein